MKIHKRRRNRRVLLMTVVLAAILTTITVICINAASCGEASTATEPPETPTAAVSPTPEQVPVESTIRATAADTEPTSTEWSPDEHDVELIAKTLYGECRGVSSKAEQAAVAWCILNRVDSSRYPNTVKGVVTQPYQFSGYSEDYPVWQNLKELAIDVLTRWHNEHEGDTNVGRTLPKEYVFFTGDGLRNYFTVEWKSNNYWEWTLPNPYAEDTK